MIRRPALPYPPQALRDRQYLTASPRTIQKKLFDRLQQEHHDLRYRLELLEARLDAVSRWQSESPTTTPSAKSPPFTSTIMSIQQAIGQLHWEQSQYSNPSLPGHSAGNVSGIAWCNGIWLTEKYFLTVGHCFENSGGWQRPNRYGSVPPPKILAKFFNIRSSSSNVILDGKNQSHPISELVHHRPLGLDCSLVRIDITSGSKNMSIAHPLLANLAREHEDSSFVNEDMFLVDFPCLHTQSEYEKANIYPIHITQHEHTSIKFYSSSAENTLSGTPVITSDGKLVGIKVSYDEALDIRSIRKLLALENTEHQHTHA